jgi:hypothetical protein
MQKKRSTKRIRRSREDGVAAALKMAESGPFTSGEFALKETFTSNRARQLLEELKQEKKLVTLGLRKSLRGKPSTLWGFPGTELTDADRAARAPIKPAAARQVASVSRPAAVLAPASPPASARRIAAPDPGVAPGGSFLDRIWAALEIGLEIEDPDGRVYTLRLSGAGSRR